jgi:hypothetical protein
MKICPEDEFTNGVLQGGVSRGPAVRPGAAATRSTA